MPFTIDFSGKTFVVTGGNRGIGAVLSKSIAEAGGDVAVLYRSSDSAPKFAADLAKQTGRKVKAYQCDVTNAKRVQEVFAEVVKDFDTFHGLVANAGVAIVKPALEIGQEEFDFMYKTNVFGVFNAAQAAAKHWIDVGYKTGTIVVISSMSSQIYNQEGLNKPLQHVFYNSSKAAVSSMTKALAAEWAPYGIRLNIVSPGYVETEQSGVHAKEKRDFMAGSTPLQRFSQPIEHAPQVLLLLSEFSSYTTGSEIFIDGGFLIY